MNIRVVTDISTVTLKPIVLVYPIDLNHRQLDQMQLLADVWNERPDPEYNHFIFRRESDLMMCIAACLVLEDNG